MPFKVTGPLMSNLTGGVFDCYRQKVDSKELDADEYQERVAHSLQSLSDEVSNYSPFTGSSLFSKVCVWSDYCFINSCTQKKSNLMPVPQIIVNYNVCFF